MAKPRQYQQLKRSQQATRQRFERVLIVCEGEKSECLYLEEARRMLQLPAVRIVGRGAGPSAVWKYAQETFERKPEYDRVVCVFDRDTHQDYAPVLADIRQQGEQGRIGKRKAGGTRLVAIPSDPCFEYWLLLHFIPTTASFSGPADVIARLRRCDGMADYGKTTAGLFQRLEPRLETAAANARQVRQAMQANGSGGPMTRFDELVEYLLEQGRSRSR